MKQNHSKYSLTLFFKRNMSGDSFSITRNRFVMLFYFLIIFPGFVSAQSDYFVTSNDGVRIHIQEFGKGEPVIFLAGGPGLNAIYMQAVWQRLSKSYRCIILNQRGTDSSLVPVVDSASLSMDNYVNDIETLRKHLRLDKLTLLGHSWGGMLCMAYFAKKPGHVKKIILLDPGGPSEKFEKSFGDNINKRLTPEDLAEIKRLDSLGLNHSKAMLPGYFYDRNRALAFARETPENNHGQPGVPNYAVANYFAGSAVMMMNLKKTTAPVFLIQGKEDPLGASTVMDIKEVLPQTAVHFIEHAGHFPWLENQEQVREFFKQLKKDLGR